MDSTKRVEGVRLTMLGNRHLQGTLIPLVLFVALAVGLGCRKELPELFDRNIPPETYITSAPVESLFDGFKVHINWFGRDSDGEVAYYLWSWTDSSRAWFAAWNPETNANDRVIHGPEFAFDETQFTERTDTTFILPANDNGGTSRDLTFNVTAVDDKGRRDPVPARRYFTASVDRRPWIIWREVPPETLDVGEPGSLSFTGMTENDPPVIGFQWSTGSEPGFMPMNPDGDAIWTYQIGDPNDYPDGKETWEEFKGDTLINLTIANDVEGDSLKWKPFYRHGTYPVKVKCIDIAGVESEIEADPENLKGVILPVLNADPDTRLRPLDGSRYPIVVSYRDTSDVEQTIELDVTPDFSGGAGFYYNVADTIPWGENVDVELNFQGWDRDNPVLMSAVQDTLRFQMDYQWRAPSLSNIDIVMNGSSGERYPSSDNAAGIGFRENLDLPFDHWNGSGQHYSMNILPVDYSIRGYSIDHYGRVDGTPMIVNLTAGFRSVVDSIIISSYAEAPTQSRRLYPPLGPAPTVKLVAWDTAGFPETLRFRWDEDSNTAKIMPIMIEDVPNIGIECTYDIMMTIYGHDDPRNGINRQLGRILWDLQDEDYSNSATQFSNDFVIEEGGFVKSWWAIVDSGDPDENEVYEGSYSVRLQVKELYSVLSDPSAEEPLFLGDKTFEARFTNTLSTDLHNEMIEGVVRRTLSLNTVGRISEMKDADFSIIYEPVGP